MVKRLGLGLGLGLGQSPMSLSSLKNVPFVPSKPQILHFHFWLLFCLYQCVLLLFVLEMNLYQLINVNIMSYYHFDMSQVVYYL